MNQYNQLFNLDNYIGTDVISEEEFQCLMADGKLYVTSCRMDGVTARKAIGEQIHPYKEEASYTGLIVADSLLEAERIAEERGYGETIEFVLAGVININRNDIDTANNLTLN